MAISPVGGTTASSAVNVTTLTVTYSPTAGNTLVLIVILKSNTSGLTFQDNLGNTYAPDNSSATTVVYHISNCPAGITGFTATWTNSQTAIIALEEYSGASGAVYLTAAQSSTLSGSIYYSGDYIVGLGSFGSAITITSGTQRQASGVVNSQNLVIADNTSASTPPPTGTSLAITETGGTSPTWFIFLVGGPGYQRVSQDVQLIANKPSSPNIRVSQDFSLPLRSGNPNALLSQDILLVIGHSRKVSLVSQDVTLVLIANPPAAGGEKAWTFFGLWTGAGPGDSLTFDG